jgi:S1-C subfamily serine protease
MKAKVIFVSIVLMLTSTLFGQTPTSLNAYKYVYVPTLQYGEGRFDIWGISSLVRELFSKKGFIVLTEQSSKPEEILNDPCLLLRCTIEHSNKEYGTNTVTLNLVNCMNERIYSSKGSAMGWTVQDDFNKATKRAFERIASLIYVFDNSLTPTFSSSEIEKTNETEETLRAYLITAKLDPIEGIYNSYKNAGSAYYRVGIVKSGDMFRAIIIESSLKAWKAGEIKAIFEPSSIRNIYAAKWYMANKTRYDTFGVMENSGLLSIDFINPQTGDKKQDKLVKMFPPISDDAKILPEGSFVSGSGFFISTGGIIATNAHVVEKAKNIEISIVNEIGNFTYKAKVLLADSSNDVALLQIDDVNFRVLSTLPYGFTERADTGEKVFTIGYPLNDIMGSNFKVTDGIISAISGIADDVRYLQISVPLQPGNSGGPLFNKEGNIIGLTSAKLNSKAVGTEIENVNYAIKASYLVSLYNMLPNSEKLGASSAMAGKQLQEQVKVLKNYVCIIKAY